VPLLQFHTAGVRVALDCADTSLAALVADVGSSMLADRTGPSAPDVTLVGPLVDGDDIGSVAAQALSLVDRAALGATSCLTVHAAALAGPAGCVVVPGASGVGKTTLAAAAMQCGLALLSDEAACFTSPVGTLIPHPRPLGLSRASRSLLGLGEDDDPSHEQATAPSLLGTTAAPSWSGRCVLVAVPDRRPGVEASLSDIAAAEALPALLSSCLNVPPLDGQVGWQPAEAWRYLSELVTGVRLVRLTFDDPYAAAELLSGALEAL
jgi:hypothetical protein